MTTVYVIIGLPGSGKTTLARGWTNWQNAKKSDSAILFDDLSLNFNEIPEKFNPKVHEFVFITDPKMCGVSEDHIKKKLQGLLRVVCDYRFYYFQNDPEACIVNATSDPKPGGTINFIRLYSPHYTIPLNATILNVYRP